MKIISRTLRFDRTLRLVWQAGPRWTLAGLVLVIVQGLLPLLAFYLMKLIVDGVTAALAAPAGEEGWRHVLILIGLAAVVAIAAALCQSAASLVREAQALRLTDHMYDLLHAKSAEVDLRF
jgi:ATP-binding cassette subfamily B protein